MWGPTFLQTHQPADTQHHDTNAPQRSDTTHTTNTTNTPREAPNTTQTPRHDKHHTPHNDKHHDTQQHHATQRPPPSEARPTTTQHATPRSHITSQYAADRSSRFSSRSLISFRPRSVSLGRLRSAATAAPSAPPSGRRRVEVWVCGWRRSPGAGSRSAHRCGRGMARGSVWGSGVRLGVRGVAVVCPVRVRRSRPVRVCGHEDAPPGEVEEGRGVGSGAGGVASGVASRQMISSAAMSPLMENWTTCPASTVAVALEKSCYASSSVS